MSANWDRLEDIFAQAIELSPRERSAFLDQKCAGSPELREELESLLLAHEQAEVSFTSRSLAVREILGALGPNLLTGRKLGVYEMGSIVGEGGMGVVYQALDTRDDTTVAVKVLPHELSFDSPWRRRFAREVRATAAVHHPGVVRVLDYGEDSGCLFLVMELIAGRSLRATLAEGKLPLEKVLDYALQIAAALEAAHTAGVIHHDLKPGNIMVTPEGQLKVVDFGLSRFNDDSSPNTSGSRLSQVGTPAGTIDYLSPEQAGGRAVDTRSDLFAMGSVLHEMLTGRRAFHRSTNLETAAAILRDQPEPLPDSVPAPVARLVEKCLAKDPEKRVQSAADLRAALEVLQVCMRAGKLKPRRFRLAPRIAARAIAAATGIGCLVVVGIFVSRPKAQRPLRFQRLTDDPHVTTEPALSLDGRWLAYASDRAEDGNVDIWIQPTGTGNARRLTNHPAVDHQPALSPDGSLLAFRSEREPAGIYLMPVNGGAERLIAAGGREPRFSPDGRWIAYWAGPDVNGDAQAFSQTAIFAIPAGGGMPSRLAEEFTDASHPVWSPDSGNLLFTGHRKADASGTEFWMAPLAGGAPRLKARWGRQDVWNSVGPPKPLAWPEKNRLLLSWSRSLPPNSVPQIFRMRFPARPETEEPVAEQLTPGAGPYTCGTTDRTGAIVVAGGPTRSAIWSLPIESAAAQVHGVLSPLVLEGEEDFLNSITADGKQLMFESVDAHRLERWVLRDLHSGKETVLRESTALGSMLLERDGRLVAVNEIAEEPPRQGELTLPPALGVRTFRSVQVLWDLSRDGTRVLSAGLRRPRSVTLAAPSPQEPVRLLEHPAFNLYLAFFSPDDRWIMVTAESGMDPPHLFAAPFHPPYPVPVSNWVDLGEGSFGQWAPSGNRIYFLREHQGWRCIYTLALDPLTKRPVSQAVAVLHLHSAWRSPLQLKPGYFRLTVAPDRLVFPLGERQSNLWLAEP